MLSALTQKNRREQPVISRLTLNKNVLEFEIDTYEIGMEEYIEAIEKYSRLCKVKDKIRRNIELAFEELVKKNILQFIEHNDDEGLPVTVTVERYGLFASPQMTITYGGDKYDPVFEGDELSSLISRKLFRSVKHNFADKNIITIKF